MGHSNGTGPLVVVGTTVVVGAAVVVATVVVGAAVVVSSAVVVVGTVVVGVAESELPPQAETSRSNARLVVGALMA